MLAAWTPIAPLCLLGANAPVAGSARGASRLAANPGPRRSDVDREEISPDAAADLWSGPALARAAKLSRELDDALEKLADARQQLDEALKRDRALERQAALLERELADARKFVYRDELTGLPNRRLLQEHWLHATARAVRQSKQVAVLFLDLDGFKQINDTLGHAGGDVLLQQAAARLLACVRASDTAARLGGDEFVVLLPDIDGPQCAAAAAAKIRARLAPPYRVDRRAIAMTVSMGMAVYPADGEELSELLKLSDRAMYRDKMRSRAPSIGEPIVGRDATP
jgi:diguanylate cyclase (GGDEF)-like protein